MYELSCGRSGAVYIAEPPAGVPVAALLSAAASRALGSPVALPLDALFGCAPASIRAVHDALMLSSGDKPHLKYVLQSRLRILSVFPWKQPISVTAHELKTLKG